MILFHNPRSNRTIDITTLGWIKTYLLFKLHEFIQISSNFIVPLYEVFIFSMEFGMG